VLLQIQSKHRTRTASGWRNAVDAAVEAASSVEDVEVFLVVEVEMPADVAA